MSDSKLGDIAQVPDIEVSCSLPNATLSVSHNDDSIVMEKGSESLGEFTLKKIDKQRKKGKKEKIAHSMALVDNLKKEEEYEKEQDMAWEPPVLAKGGHMFSTKTFNSPTYCAMCHGFIWGLRKQGSSCHVCAMPVHNKCRDDEAVPCYHPEPVEVSSAPGSVAFQHHWIAGNVGKKKSCDFCGKSTAGSGGNFKCLKCSRCRRAVHESCLENNPLVCLPPLRNLYFCHLYMKSPRDGYQPLLVYVNTKSGGQQGNMVLSRMRRQLTKEQVIDMFENKPVGPKATLEKYVHVPNLKILVCGGDGTAGWVLSEMDKLENPPAVLPPMAVLPLGTGNDLARVLGWGGGYTGEKMLPILQSVEKSDIVKLDRWKVTIAQEDGSVNEYIVNNYFSFGLDAKIALKFHLLREEKPELFKSRTLNKGFYGTFGMQNAVSKSETMESYGLCMQVDGEEFELTKDHKSLEGLVFLNIQSYGGGSDLWGKVSTSSIESPNPRKKRLPAAMDDGLLEVVGLRGVAHLVGLQTGMMGGERIVQGQHFVLSVKECTVQVDGEPFSIKPSTITVTYHNQFSMLSKQK